MPPRSRKRWPRSRYRASIPSSRTSCSRWTTRAAWDGTILPDYVVWYVGESASRHCRDGRQCGGNSGTNVGASPLPASYTPYQQVRPAAAQQRLQPDLLQPVGDLQSRCDAERRAASVRRQEHRLQRSVARCLHERVRRLPRRQYQSHRQSCADRCGHRERRMRRRRRHAGPLRVVIVGDDDRPTTPPGRRASRTRCGAGRRAASRAPTMRPPMATDRCAAATAAPTARSRPRHRSRRPRSRPATTTRTIRTPAPTPERSAASSSRRSPPTVLPITTRSRASGSARPDATGQWGTSGCGTRQDFTTTKYVRYAASASGGSGFDPTGIQAHRHHVLRHSRQRRVRGQSLRTYVAQEYDQLRQVLCVQPDARPVDANRRRPRILELRRHSSCASASTRFGRTAAPRLFSQRQGLRRRRTRRSGSPSSTR